MHLPSTKRFEWNYIFLISFIINFMAIIFSRISLNVHLDTNETIVFAIISFVVASLTCLGYFGLRLFTITFMTANFIALLNMFYVTITNQNDGWSDLTSVVIYLFLIVLGFLFALLAEVIGWTLSLSDKEEKRKALLIEEQQAIKKKAEATPKKVKKAKITKVIPKKTTKAKVTKALNKKSKKNK